jgi:hypothetical protein
VRVSPLAGPGFAEGTYCAYVGCCDLREVVGLGGGLFQVGKLLVAIDRRALVSKATLEVSPCGNRKWAGSLTC